MRRAYADRARYMGDPSFNNIRQDKVLSDSYATQLAANINLTKASNSLKLAQLNDKEGKKIIERYNRESNQTTHLIVVDKDRNAVSLTFTINWNKRPNKSCSKL